MNWLKALFAKIDSYIHSPAAAAVEAKIEELLPFGIEIVKDLTLMAPNKSLTELNNIAVKYGLPIVTAIADGQTAGNVLLNYGSQILEKNHAPGTATSLLNTVIQNAYIGLNPPSLTPAS